MAQSIFKTGPGIAPYLVNDTTRNWIEQFGRKNGLLNPQALVRVATDTNYLFNTRLHLYGRADEKQVTKAMMNLGLPGQLINGLQSISVTESDDSVQTASLDLFNCLPISKISTTLTSSLPALPFPTTVKANYVANSLGVIKKLTGNSNGTNIPPTQYRDASNIYYREENVKYREFENFAFSVASSTGFPNPAIPNDDDNDIPNSGWAQSNSGSGAYYVLIGTEVVRVVQRSANVFYIPPGGRGIGSQIQAHSPGEVVQLLGFGTGSWTGDVTAVGYLNIDDFKPQTCLLRPGTGLVTYEGWGDILGQNLSGGRFGLSHQGGVNYAFTGYWFISGIEPSYDENAIPRIRLDLKSAGWMYDKQRITPDLLRRAKNQFGQWEIGQTEAASNGQSIWQAAGHTRNIPGDWVDYNSWDPSLPGSYPLRIKIEVAQHKEFYDHMTETDFGNKCELCRQEKADWEKYHDKTDYLAENKAIGRHIYKSSIRVLDADAGPIKTYIRLMATIAAAAWDHPAYGTELSQAFTKIPNTLWNNIRTVNTGLIFNGQLMLNIEGVKDSTFDWFTPTYTDEDVAYTVHELTCPFEATYDRAPFSQPMQELADANGANFWVTREGFPVFKPKLFNFRPFDAGGEWFHSYGASISSYSHNINADSVITQVWVSATSAFQSSMTTLTGGTGLIPKSDGTVSRLLYSGLGGNSQGLALTSGVQQVETVSMDNQQLGLSWNMKPSGYAAIEKTPDGVIKLNAMPDLFEGNPTITATNDKDHPAAVKKIQRTLNWFLVRRYIIVAADPKQLTLDVNGKFDTDTVSALNELQKLVGRPTNSNYSSADFDAIKKYVSTDKHYIQFDIFWYVMNHRSWEEYLSAITGVPIVMSNTDDNGGTSDQNVTEDTELPSYAVNDAGTQKAVGEWTKTFAKSVINYGARVVDDSINKATARTLASNFADPRIQPGDVIWCTVPGHLGMEGKQLGSTTKGPFSNGIYVTNITRQMDLTTRSYSATYSGHRFIGDFKQGLNQKDLEQGYMWK